MSTYTITHKPGFRKGYTVTDAYSSVVYRVKQSFCHLTNTYVITDAADNLMAKIRQRISLIVPAYKIELSHAPPISIAQQLCFGIRFTIKGKPWSMSGSKDWEGYIVLNEKEETLYKIIKNDKKGEKSYIVELRQDPLIGICLTIAADLAKRAIRQA